MSDEPDCPYCDTDLLVVRGNRPGFYQCHGCGESFGPDRRPIPYYKRDAWVVSSNAGTRRVVHADDSCQSLEKAHGTIEWNQIRAKASPLPRCSYCGYTVRAGHE